MTISIRRPGVYGLRSQRRLDLEIVSPHDRSREKLEFYASVGMRELLLVDRDPWSLELFRLSDDVLAPVGRSTIETPTELRSEIVPLAFALQPGETRPQIVARHHDQQQTWVI